MLVCNLSQEIHILGYSGARPHRMDSNQSSVKCFVPHHVHICMVVRYWFTFTTTLQ